MSCTTGPAPAVLPCPSWPSASRRRTALPPGTSRCSPRRIWGIWDWMPCPGPPSTTTWAPAAGNISLRGTPRVCPRRSGSPTSTATPPTTRWNGRSRPRKMTAIISARSPRRRLTATPLTRYPSPAGIMSSSGISPSIWYSGTAPYLRPRNPKSPSATRFWITSGSPPSGMWAMSRKHRFPSCGPWKAMYRSPRTMTT